VRGSAYMAAGKGAEAAREFEKVVRHRGIVVSDPMGAMAPLQLARAYARSNVGAILWRWIGRPTEKDCYLQPATKLVVLQVDLHGNARAVGVERSNDDLDTTNRIFHAYKSQSPRCPTISLLFGVFVLTSTMLRNKHSAYTCSITV
jgi:hypothetical protein